MQSTQTVLVSVKISDQLSKTFVVDESAITFSQEILNLELVAPMHDQVTLDLIKIEQS